MIPSRRVTSCRQTAIDSPSAAASFPPFSFFSFRSISWRWMVSEFSGFPSSWATPAASSRIDEIRSSSIIRSVVCFSRVTSVRMTAKCRIFSRTPSTRNGTMYRRTVRVWGYVSSTSRAIDRNGRPAAQRGLQRAAKAGHQAPERRAGELALPEADQAARRLVRVFDAPVRIDDQDALVDRVEDGLEQAALPRQALDEVRQVHRVERIQAPEHAIEVAVFPACHGSPLPSNDRRQQRLSLGPRIALPGGGARDVL